MRRLMRRCCAMSAPYAMNIRADAAIVFREARGYSTQDLSAEELRKSAALLYARQTYGVLCARTIVCLSAPEYGNRMRLIAFQRLIISRRPCPPMRHLRRRRRRAFRFDVYADVPPGAPRPICAARVYAQRKRNAAPPRDAVAALC